MKIPTKDAIFTTNELQDKLIMHENELRECTPDPTNLRRNQKLLRELESQRLVIIAKKIVEEEGVYSDNHENIDQDHIIQELGKDMGLNHEARQ